jgi:N-acetyl-anhydromuramyl-L-alanine amidase AmpD
MKRVLFFLAFLTLGTNGIFSLTIVNNMVTNERKIELLTEYCKWHYGLDSIVLKDPKIIVIHYTELPVLKDCLVLFSNDIVAPDRTDIKNFGSANVGVHYLIAKDGTVFCLYPTNMITRHVIGFNYTAIGVENAARSQKDMTEAQLKANAELVHYLVGIFPSIKYLIGHCEYNIKNLPHFQYFLELDKKYIPHDSPDPGPKFMAQLREKLKKDYSIELLK